MKTIPALLQTHYDSGGTTAAHALKITRTDGEIFGFTSTDQDLILDGVTYDSSQGLDVSNIATTSSLSVDNLELTTVDDGTLFVRSEVLGGIWKNAAFVIFRYNWANPSNGVEYIMGGSIGNVKLLRGYIVVEMRGLQQYMQQPIGDVTSKTCRARFCDFPTQNGNNRCGLVAAAWTDGLYVTSVIDDRTFSVGRVSGAVRASNWYDEGIVTWTTGANTGLQQRIKSFNHSPAEMELAADMPFPIVNGDHLNALAGCRKRLTEDCLNKFDNVHNFQGEPHASNFDELTVSPSPQA